MARFLVPPILLATIATCSLASANDWRELRILVLAGHGDERGNSIAESLQQHFKHVGVSPLDAFDREDVTAADVVVLDWDQSVLFGNERQKMCPLGERDDWSKPTVLLGSAGLVLASRWELVGDGG